MKFNFKGVSLTLLLGLFVVSCSDDDKVIPSEDFVAGVEYDAPDVPTDTAEKGFYVLNEDWFGHDDGSINYFDPSGEIIYRAYRKANPGEKFGVTSQYGTVYGDNLYVTSKQGNRLVVADKVTLKKKASLEETGGDGRGFAGVSPEKAYMATGNGISIINLTDYSFVKAVAGVSGEVGTLLYANGYLFAVTHNNVVVIDTKTDEVFKTLEIANPACMARSKDGYIWVGSAKELTKIDPQTLEFSVEQDITGFGVFPTWFAWTKGFLVASTQENTLYWATGDSSWGVNRVAKYDIDTKTVTADFFAVTTEKDHGISEDAEELDFYGSAINVNPINDEVVLQVKRIGFGESGSYNWLFILDKKGELKRVITVGDDNTGDDGAPGKEPEENRYYWFPAMPLFSDFYKPEILVNSINLLLEEPIEIDLEKLVYDRDTSIKAIELSFDIEAIDEAIDSKIDEGKLLLKATQEGEFELKITANSNGDIVNRTIPIVVKK